MEAKIKRPQNVNSASVFKMVGEEGLEPSKPYGG